MSFIDDIVGGVLPGVFLDFGTPVIWRAKSTKRYVPGSGSVTGGDTMVTVVTRGVVEEAAISGAGPEDFNLKKVTCPAADFSADPEEGDTYEIGGRVHTVLSASRVMGVDSPALMVAMVRQEKRVIR